MDEPRAHSPQNRVARRVRRELELKARNNLFDRVSLGFAEALKKVESEKSSCGKTFGELIKAGELPGGK